MAGAFVRSLYVLPLRGGGDVVSISRVISNLFRIFLLLSLVQPLFGWPYPFRWTSVPCRRWARDEKATHNGDILAYINHILFYFGDFSVHIWTDKSQHREQYNRQPPIVLYCKLYALLIRSSNNINQKNVNELNWTTCDCVSNRCEERKKKKMHAIINQMLQWLCGKSKNEAKWMKRNPIKKKIRVTEPLVIGTGQHPLTAHTHQSPSA